MSPPISIGAVCTAGEVRSYVFHQVLRSVLPEDVVLIWGAYEPIELADNPSRRSMVRGILEAKGHETTDHHGKTIDDAFRDAILENPTMSSESSIIFTASERHKQSLQRRRSSMDQALDGYFPSASQMYTMGEAANFSDKLGQALRITDRFADPEAKILYPKDNHPWYHIIGKALFHYRENFWKPQKLTEWHEYQRAWLSLPAGHVHHRDTFGIFKLRSDAINLGEYFAVRVADQLCKEQWIVRERLRQMPTPTDSDYVNPYIAKDEGLRSRTPHVFSNYLNTSG